eukprot:GHVU01141140.1.p1 GENE.GHVU01141140.1~~GHVU01141140.1.p1  ORF type:complete len:176 (-),score=2.94 GHVU01141140.1:36-563(-)
MRLPVWQLRFENDDKSDKSEGAGGGWRAPWSSSVDGSIVGGTGRPASQPPRSLSLSLSCNPQLVHRRLGIGIPALSKDGEMRGNDEEVTHASPRPSSSRFRHQMNWIQHRIAFIHSLTHSFARSRLCHPLSHSLFDLLIRVTTRCRNAYEEYSFTHSLTHSFIHSFIYSFIRSND